MDRYTVARKGLKTSLTLLENYLKNTVIDPVQAKHRFELLKSKYETYLQVFEQADDTDELYSEVQEFSDRYYQLLSSIPTDTPETKPVVENSVANIKLPELALPEFNGDYIFWPQFRNTFLSLICTNANLSNINKFHYLEHTSQENIK